MRTSFTTLIALALIVPMTPPVSAAQETGAPIALKLSCEGEGDRGNHNLYRARVFVHVEGASGEILIPGQIVPGFGFRKSVDTWYPLHDLVVGQDEITARVRFNALSSTRVMLDRINGEIHVSGMTGSFASACEPYDPDNVRRAF